MKTSNLLEDVSIVFGVTIGLAQIETILGIIILSFQILLIGYKMIRNIIKDVKNRDYDSIEEDIKDATDKLNKLTNKDKDGK